MRRPVNDIHDDQNYDSFLDIVANLVGILVILIMVIGVRARQAVSTVTSEVATPVAAQDATVIDSPPAIVEPPVPTGPLASEIALRVSQERAAAERLHADIHAVAMKAEDLGRMAAAKAEERNQLQLMVAVAEQSLEKRRQTLSQKDKIQLAVASELDSSRVELARLREQLGAVESAVDHTEVVKHHPTPIAKTVFGQEEHFRLKNGRLAYVPVAGMTTTLKADAQNNLWKMGTTDEVTELIGPQDGFMMKYTLQRSRRQVDTPEGPRMASLIELKRFVMVPQSSGLGETVDQALALNSRFEQQLAGMRSDETTITVWTYPDSYGDFRRVKERLSERGFLAAARPLPEGYPIGGSPGGAKSSAE